MSFKDRFSGHAADYARHRPTYPPALVDALAERASGTTLAWDVGCGSGQLSTLLAARFTSVVATDPSERQLAHAPPRAGVTYRVARAEASGLPARSADLVVAAQAAHWFDLDAFYAEARRVARPGALIALVTYGLLHVDEVVDPVVEAFYDGDLGAYWPPERRLVDEGYRSLPFPFEPVPMPALDMVATWPLDGVVGFIHTWSGLKALEQSGDEGKEAIARFESELARVWGDPSRAREIRWPLSIRAGRIS